MRFYALALMVALAALPCVAQLSDVQNPNQQTKNDAGAKALPPSVTAARLVLQELTSGQFDKVEAQYDAQMTAANHPGTLAQAWASLQSTTGGFQSVSEARIGKVQNLDAVMFLCKFEKSLAVVEVIFGVDGKIAGLHFGSQQPPWSAPSYAQPSSFTEQPLDLVNGAFDLPGTLTIPTGTGPFPAVVLIPDSGPHDEDETLGPNKPLKDLAWGLASHGIAVYRYTKRTAKYGAKSNANPADLTVNDEVISDARAAAALLGKQPKVDSSRVYLVGLGLGGYLAPRIVSGDAQISGIVAMAASARPLEKGLLSAVKYIAKEDAAEGQAASADKPSLTPKATSGAAPPTAQPSAADEQVVAKVEDSEKQIENPALKLGDNVAVLDGTMPAAYWLDLRDYNPVQVAEKLRIPILILQGGRDFQVTPEGDFSVWQSAFAHRRNVKLKLYPDLNHLFMFGTGPSLPAEYVKPGHMDQQVITDVAAWITAGGKPPAPGAAAN